MNVKPKAKNRTPTEGMSGIVFHENHGTNVALSNGAKTATRKDNSVTNRGIVLASRPLMKSEEFEVELIEADAGIQGNGLEIGVTNNNPDKFDMVRTMTDCKVGHNLIVSDRQLVENGEPIDIMNNSIADMGEGDRLSVKITSDGKRVEFLLNGECQTQADLQAGKKYWPVIDLYGKARQVTIPSSPRKTPKSDFEERLCNIKILLEEMQKKTKSNKEQVHSLVMSIYKGYEKIKREDRKRLAKSLKDQGGAKIITAYLKFLKDVGVGDQKEIEIYCNTRGICWNYGDDSIELCIGFGQAGLFPFLIDDLKSYQREYRNSSLKKRLVYEAFGIIHNCAKANENQVILRSLRFIDIAKEYTDTSKTDAEIILNAVMSMSYVMEENEASLARLEKETIRLILGRLKKALTTDPIHQHDGWHAYELCDGLANLAQDYENLKYVVQVSGVTLFLGLVIRAKDDQEKISGLNAIDAHTIRASAKVISEEYKMLETLTRIQVKEKGRVKELAVQILRKLQEHPEFKSIVTSKKGTSDQTKKPAKEPGKKEEFVQLAGSMEREMILTPGQTMPTVIPGSFKDCEYKQLCSQFKLSLNIFDAYFDSRYDQCYCAGCHKKRGDDDYYKRGTPPKLYGMPVGWCRFALALPPRAKALEVSKKWHRAFHGTKHQYVGSILEVGEIVAAGRAVLGGKDIFERSGHFNDHRKPAGFDTKMVFLSPSIHYSGHSAYATPQQWTAANGQKYQTRVAFQVFISPDSYKAGKETIAASKQIDPRFSNSEIEWMTNQQGSTILYGLLVKVDALS